MVVFAGAAVRAAADVQLVAFPEMCITGYWHVRELDREGIAALAEPIPDGSSVQRLIALARRHRLVIGAGLIAYEAPLYQVLSLDPPAAAPRSSRMQAIDSSLTRLQSLLSERRGPAGSGS